MTVDGRRRFVPLGAVAVVHATNDSYTYLLPALMPALLVRLDVGLGVAGLLISLHQAAVSFAQPLFGHFGDRGARTRWMAWVGVALSGIGFGVLGAAPGLIAVAAALLVAGLGSALFHPAGAALVAGSVPPQSRGRWMSLYVTSGNVGLPLGPLVGGAILVVAGLEGLWVIAIPALAASLLMWRFGPSVARASAPPVALRTVIRENRSLLAGLVSVATARAWANGLVISFLPVYAIALGASLLEASHLLTLLLLSGTVGSLGGGWLADRFGRDRMIVASLLAAAPFCVALALQETVGPAFIVATAMSGMLLNGPFAMLAVRAQESLPRNLGMVSGLMLGLALGLGGLGIAPMGVLAERAGLALVFGAAAAIAVAGAILMRAVPAAPLASGMPAASAEGR